MNSHTCGKSRYILDELFVEEDSVIVIIIFFKKFDAHKTTICAAYDDVLRLSFDPE